LLFIGRKPGNLIFYRSKESRERIFNNCDQKLKMRLIVHFLPVCGKIQLDLKGITSQ